MKKARSEKEIEGKSREIESWSLAHTHACEYFLFSFSWKDLISTKSCKFLSDPSSSKGYYFFFSVLPQCRRFWCWKIFETVYISSSWRNFCSYVEAYGKHLLLQCFTSCIFNVKWWDKTQHYLPQVAINSSSFHVDHVNCQCNQKSWMELFVQWNEFL